MKFNQTTSTESNRTTNYEGGEAFRPESPAFGLYKVVINNLLEDTYYEEDTESLRKLGERFVAAADEDPQFPLQLAAYARQEMYLRDVAQVLLVLAAQHDDAKGYVREYAPQVIRRADELNTVVAIQLSLFGKPIPKPLKKGVADAFDNFDRYQFAKYDTQNREVTFRDVMNLVHPKPEGEEQEEIFERLIYGDLDDYPEIEPLEPPHTWEVVISERGNTAEAWREVLPDMGIFATIRNLRNMLEAGLSGEEILTEDDLAYAERSKVYPFRFYQAYQAVTDAGVADEHTKQWLSAAVDRTAGNVPERLGDTFVAVDLSGSMDSRLSANSSMTYKEIAAFFGAVLAKQGADVSVFATDFEVVIPADGPIGRSGLGGSVRALFGDEALSEAETGGGRDLPSTLDLAAHVRDRRVGGSTNGWKALKHLVETESEYDRVVLLTDMQIWDSTWGSARDAETVRQRFDQYRSQVNPEASLYTIDLASYGDLVTPEGYEGVYHVSGWTSEIVDFVVYAEDHEGVLAEIREF